MNEQENEKVGPDMTPPGVGQPRNIGTPSQPEPADDGQQEKPKKRKKKHKTKLNAEKVGKVIGQLGGSATMDEILVEIYGEVNKTLRSRVYHHVHTLREQGSVYTTGSNQNMTYHLKDSTRASASEPGIGDLFEAVGLIDDKRVVRSLDSHQLYRLERL